MSLFGSNIAGRRSVRKCHRGGGAAGKSHKINLFEFSGPARVIFAEQRNDPALIAQLAGQGKVLPDYVRQEFEDYLRCRWPRKDLVFWRDNHLSCHKNGAYFDKSRQ